METQEQLEDAQHQVRHLQDILQLTLDVIKDSANNSARRARSRSPRATNLNTHGAKTPEDAVCVLLSQEKEDR